MDRWDEEFRGQVFVTDLGGSREVEVEGVKTALNRYAVWIPEKDRHRIVEVGADLDLLRRKYHIPLRRVCALARG